MFSRNTVFVVGAGASSEADLPVGAQLATAISQVLNFEVGRDGSVQSSDPVLWESLQQHLRNSADSQRLVPVAKQIAQCVQRWKSIDNYIDAHNDDELVGILGKAGIVSTILTAERNSRIYADRSDGTDNFNFSKLTDTWYPVFCELLASGVKKSKVERIFDGISIICFNYDRCIEEYIDHWIRSAYGIGEQESRAIIGGLKKLQTLWWHRPAI